VRGEALNVPGRLPTEGGQDLGHNPFGALDGAGLPRASARRSEPAPAAVSRERNRGRVDITREKGGRGGKTVTVAGGFVGIGLPEKQSLAAAMRSACGCGGTVKECRIEIHGDQRDAVARILSEAGFRPVFAGG
jgi:translation initiation factor 1